MSRQLSQPVRTTQIQTGRDSEVVSVGDFLALVGYVRSLQQIVNGGLSFGDGSQSSQAGNFFGQVIQYKFSATGTTYRIPHSLGKTPVFCIPFLCDTSGLVVYDPLLGANWSPRTIELRSSAIGTAKLLVL